MKNKFRAATEPGKITFNDASDHEVAIPLSFFVQGFCPAYAALLKQ